MGRCARSGFHLPRRVGNRRFRGPSGEFRGRVAGISLVRPAADGPGYGGPRWRSYRIALGANSGACSAVCRNYGRCGWCRNGGVFLSLGTGFRTHSSWPHPGLRTDDDCIGLGCRPPSARRDLSLDRLLRFPFLRLGRSRHHSRDLFLVRSNAFMRRDFAISYRTGRARSLDK